MAPPPLTPKVKLILIISGAVLGAAVVAVLLGVLLSQSLEGSNPDGPIQPTTPSVTVSAKNELLFAELDGATRANGDPIVIARSYDGNPWEPVSDLDNNKPASVSCQTQGCTITSDKSFTIRSAAVPQELTSLSAEHLASRLMMQATFGPTKTELQRLAGVYGTDYSTWILDQMRLTPTLARSYYRERANARPGQFPLGVETTPCDKSGSRWHRFAFGVRDAGKNLDISLNGVSSRFVLRVDGAVRAEVSTFLNQSYPGTGTNFTFPLTLRFCTVNEEVNGVMTLTANMSTCNVNYRNPAIENIDPAFVQSFADQEAQLVPVVGARAGSFVLKWRTVPCTNVSDSAGNSFIRQNGNTYRFDKRIRLFSNTVENPATVEATFSGQCPIIAKTYQNRDSCIRRSSCGTALSFKSATFTLDDNILRSWYTKSGRYVYYVTALKLEEPFDISPCTSGVSRWQRLGAGACPSPTTLDTTTLNTIAAALAASSDRNPFVRDITLSGAGCTASASTIGAQIAADGECFQHVHPDLFGVRDFTRWVSIHDGNEQAMAGGKPNPIANFALTGSVNLQFPGSHPMMRFFDRRGIISLIGRLGDDIDFQDLNVDLQTEEIAAIVGALRTNANGAGFEACGSPGETATIPELGQHYPVPSWNVSTPNYEGLEWPLPRYHEPMFVLENIAVKAVDQLRQRVAWSLSNIIVIASQDVELLDYTDGWTSFYDIFIRHAFGNYLNIMRDVSYHPLMGSYLSYRQNRAYAVQNTYPDENYAREIMQLFSIGLWKLNDDGTQRLDDQGEPIETYTNADIVDFARIWTGFDRQLYRSNFANSFSIFGSNNNVVDSMQIRAQWRDRLPKAKLDDGYIGDGYPLCDDLPAQAFLREGARYEFTGVSSVEGDTLDANNMTTSGPRGRFAPVRGSSALYQALCAPGQDGACTFPLRVTLTSTLTCSGAQECNAQRVLAVQINDPVANVTRYYAYIAPPCVRLTLFDSGQLIKRAGNRLQCADPITRVGSPVCCRPNSNRAASNYTSECLFANDVTDYATNQQRCANMGLGMCSSRLSDSSTWAITCAPNLYMWTNDTCAVTLQVYPSGQLGIVDPSSQLRVLVNNSNNVFRVRWTNNVFPTASNGVCPSNCVVQPTVDGDSCICSIAVTNSQGFSQPSDISSNDAVNVISKQLSIGAPKPSIFDAGTYTQCTSSDCTALSNVVVWLHKDDNGALSQRTIFELPPYRIGGRTRYLMNRVSTVNINDFSFRNPPHFTPLLGEMTDSVQEWNADSLWTRKAEYEVDALLEHLFEHDNTAPFVAYRLIQHMVTSNPSLRYVKSVVQAFRTGAHGEFQFSNRYGDLAATVYAILTDHEARSPIVEADKTFGMLRDPLLKVYHLLRALNYKTPKGREIALRDLDNIIGVEPFSSPTVFGFYLPEFRPEGSISDAGLVGPQVQLATTPNLIGFLNGVTSLVDNGLNSCDGGFGVNENYGGRRCVSTGPHETADGTLSYTPYNTDATVDEIVDDLNLLLTAGRLNSRTRSIIINEYNKIYSNSSFAAPALRQAIKVFVASPEFQTTSYNHLKEAPRQEPPKITSQGRKSKAIVVVFEYGGCDSYNVLVPLSGCPNKDLYDEYRTVREGAAISNTTLLPISVPAGTQPCNTFGVHPSHPNLHSLYNDGDALFVSNIGSLVEPVTKEEVLLKTKRLPPSLFAHNVMQRNLQTMHPQDLSSKGILGRLTNGVLNANPPFSSALFSLGGNVKMVQGSIPADFISPSAGIVRLRALNRIKDGLGNLTQFESDSVFADTFAGQLFSAVEKTEFLGALMNGTTLATTFGRSSLDMQLSWVAKLIKSLPAETGMERVAFFTQTGGFDTHDTFDLSPMFGTVDTALGTFVQEMKAQGVWDDVVVVSVSDFGRTLTNNGRGTDHAWGGHHWVAGGSVKGGQILGSYPDTLTDEGALSLGRGRIVPTTSFEAVWKGIAEWYGVPADQLAAALPNLANFPENQLFSMEQMFK